MELQETVERIVRMTPVTDMHTHLYSVDFGELSLSGIDELLIYHYLISESFRWTRESYDQFWSMSKEEQANWIWQKLFLDHSPVSEATTGVITIFNRLGLDVASRDLNAIRVAWAQRSATEHLDEVLRIANVRDIVMTNDPFDPLEQLVWLELGGNHDERFHAALRVDPLLNQWDQAHSKLSKMGYAVTQEWTEQTIAEIQRFLREWIERIDALYLAVSMPGDFAYPLNDHRSKMIDDVLIPVCTEKQIPFALMIGVRRQVNPSLRLAGDMSILSDVGAVESLCRRYPDQKFLITMLARENQHELAVLARKFRNLMVFGCWWFLHIESMVEEMTRFRMELLGTSFIPQHSDCRVLEQLIYKWEHSRTIIAKVLLEKYEKLQAQGWAVTEFDIQRDVEDLFNMNFWNFIGRNRPAPFWKYHL
jgi:hypothetical protein